MKYFVTGATGFIGGVVARKLAAEGHHVVTLARDPAKAKNLSHPQIQVVQGDITDKNSLRKPMEGVDGIYHIAGWYKIGVRDKSQAKAINVDGTRNVLELMKELGIPKGVYTSTLAVYSDTYGKAVDETYRYDRPHLSEYDRTKWLAHYEVAEPMMRQGLPLVIVQPGLVYGPGDTGVSHDTLVLYLKRQLPLVPLGNAACWGHVEDIADGHLLAMEKGRTGESYNLGGPIYTVIDALKLAEKITGIPMPRLRGYPAMMKRMSAIMRIVEKVLPVPETYSSELLRITAGVTYLGNSDKAKRELGFKPRTLEEGFPETLQWEMEQLGLQPEK